MTRSTGPENTWRPGSSLRLYRSLSPVLCGLLPLVAPFSPKLARGLAGREGLMHRLTTAAPGLQGCLWFHVSSVGEYEQARPLIAALRELDDTPPIVVTHFSPSGYEYALQRPSGDFHDYLPYDHPADMERLVGAWRPSMLIFVKYDCWPNLVGSAARRDIPVVLLAGTLQPKSVRLHPLARPMFRDLFSGFAHIGVCTEEDRRRFQDLGVDCPVTVTGDTRVEQVILRYEEAESGPTAMALQALGGPVLILGSTWPPDEKLWLPILPELLDRYPALRVVLTPHEPLPHRLEQLERSLAHSNLTTVRLSQLLADPRRGDAARVVITDSVGVLAEIYRAGDLAYVGGSFTTGVHNTMEPAVVGMPVCFGPKIGNAEEAGELVRQGAGFVLETPDQALALASRLLGDADDLKRVGDIARQVVLAQRGATARSMKVIVELLAKNQTE
jgi:3-deoxy-D-manno-octulosonic-acid transferase